MSRPDFIRRSQSRVRELERRRQKRRERRSGSGDGQRKAHSTKSTSVNGKCSSSHSAAHCPPAQLQWPFATSLITNMQIQNKEQKSGLSPSLRFICTHKDPVLNETQWLIRSSINLTLCLPSRTDSSRLQIFICHTFL